ncbi:MAG: alpha/beta hydrolase [Lapillicoccus sp.]
MDGNLDATSTDSPAVTSTHTAAPIVLAPGHWLGAWAWDDAAELRRRGRSAVADAATAGGGTSVVLVAHSGAGFPASVLLDRDPAVVARVVYVDSGPSQDRSTFDDSVSPDVVEVPLPPFEQLGEKTSLEGIRDRDLERFRERSVPEPGSILRERVHLDNEARRDVPSTIIACSYPSEVMMQMARDGDSMMAEVATLRDLQLVDLPTGHWPMWSRPFDIAAAISAASGR